MSVQHCHPAVDATTVKLNDLTVVAGYDHWLEARGLDTLEGLFSGAAGESLDKPGLDAWRERVRLTFNGEPGPRCVYLKRYANPPPAARWEVCRSGSGAASVAGVEWAWMQRLEHDGIACPRRIALGESMRGRREHRSAILIEAVGGRSLESWACRTPSPPRRQVRKIMQLTANLVGRFHGAGYVHRDLYLAHIFVTPDGEHPAGVTLIDLQRVFRPTCCRLRWIVKDLAALNYSTPSTLVSRSDRLRWLKQYLTVSKLDTSPRALVYRILGKTMSIARHDRRRLARLQPATQAQGDAIHQ